MNRPLPNIYKAKLHANNPEEFPSYANAIPRQCRSHESVSDPPILSHLWSCQGIPLGSLGILLFGDLLLRCLCDRLNMRLLSSL